MLRGQTTDTSEPTAEEIPEQGRHRARIATWVWVVIPILFLTFLLVGLHLRAYPTFSPIDERQHVDYLYRISRGDLLRMGEQIGQEALRDEACRGLDWNLFTPPPCHPNRPYNPDVYPNLGYNSAHIHPPTYYFLTNLVADSFRTTGISRDFVSSARLSGGLWLGLGLLVFWYVASELHIGPLSRVIAMVLMATTPTVLHASATVNPDSTALLAGGLLLLATLVWERKRGRTILLIPLGAVLAVALKVTNILVVGATALYLIIRWWLAWRRTRNEPGVTRGYLGAAAVLIVAGLASALLWMMTHNALIRVPFDPQTEQFRVESLPADAVVGQMLALVTPVRDPWLPSFLNNAAVKGIFQLVNLGLIAAVFGAVMFGRPRRPTTVLAISGALAILGSGALLTVVNYLLNSGTYVAIPPRYGMSVIPILFLGLASALHRPTVLWVAGLLGTASFGIVVFGMLNSL